MKKKIVRCFALGLVSMMLTMTGCGNQIPDLTEEQAKRVGEYAAVTLLKYDANHRSRLVDASEVEAYEQKLEEKKQKEQLKAEATPKPTPAPDKGNVESSDGKQENSAVVEEKISLENSLAAPEGIAVSYKNYKLCDTYPEDGSTGAYFALDASAGKQLLVMEFDVKNVSSAVQAVDFFSKNTAFTLSMANGKSVQAMTTMLLDDMSTFVGELAVGESRNQVLIFELDKDVVLEGAVLKLKSESTVYTIQNL